MKASIPLQLSSQKKVTDISQKRHETPYTVVQNTFQVIRVVCHHHLFLVSLKM